MQECKKGYMVASSSSSSSFLFSFLILVFSYLLSNVCAQFPQSKLVQPPIFESINGVLSAEIHMVMADYYEDVYPNNLSINSDFSLNSTDIFSGNFKDPNFQNATTVLGGGGGGGNIVFSMGYQGTWNGTKYNATSIGPTLKFDPEDFLNITIYNDLGRNVNLRNESIYLTNFHFHGGQVPSVATGDNVYEIVRPGESFLFQIRMSKTHPEGNMWYHVHHHGTTTTQVNGGLNGMIIVGDARALYSPSVPADIDLINLGLVTRNLADTNLGDGSQYVPGLGCRTSRFFVNGQLNPIMEWQPGETKVLYLASMGMSSWFSLFLADESYQNGWDAVALFEDGNADSASRSYQFSLDYNIDTAFLYNTPKTLGPGQRRALAVTAPSVPGTYYLYTAVGCNSVWYNPDPTNLPTPAPLLTINVAGPSMTPVPPADWEQKPFAQPLFEQRPVVNRTYNFSVPSPGGFSINNKLFGFGPLTKVQSGTVEEWTLSVLWTRYGNKGNRDNIAIPHPFHVHQGNFIVTEYQGTTIDPTVDEDPSTSDIRFQYVSSQDTVVLPGAFQNSTLNDSTVKIRFKFENFPGLMVFHCHTLKHEDLGMMNPVLLYPPTERILIGIGNILFDAYGVLKSTPISSTRRSLISSTQLDPYFRAGTSQVQNLTMPGCIPVIIASGKRNSEITASYNNCTEMMLNQEVGLPNGVNALETTFEAFPRKIGRRGVSAALGILSQSPQGLGGNPTIAILPRRRRHSRKLRMFQMDGSLSSEIDLSYAISYNCPPRKPFSMTSGDVNGENFQDLILGTCRGEVYIFDGRDILYNVAEPRFRKFRPDTRHINVAVGYNVYATIPSQTGNIIITPTRGRNRGIVQVWSSYNPTTYQYDISMGNELDFTMLVEYTPFPRYRRNGRPRRAYAVDVVSSYFQNTTDATAKSVIYARQTGNNRIAVTTFGEETIPNISSDTQYLQF